MSLRLSVALFAASCTFAAGQTVRYKSASIDLAGRLRIVQANGPVIDAPKSPDQEGFGSPAVSPDGQTVGWLESYKDPQPAGSNQDWRRVNGYLDLFRQGRVTHRFLTAGTVYAWRFWEGGTQVIYAAGGLHGGATVCERRDVKSGKLLERWGVEDHTPLPAWASSFADQLQQAP